MNESAGPAGPDELHTISAAGFSTTVDAFARDERDQSALVPVDGRLADRPKGHLGRAP